MEEIEKEQTKKIKTESKIKIFNIPYSIEEIKEDISISTKASNKNNYLSITKKKSNDSNFFIRCGISCKKQNDISEAINFFQKAIRCCPDESKAYSCLGVALIEIGKFKEAELSIRTAIKLRPDSAIDYSNLGSIKIELGEPKEAEVLIQKAIELKPDFADAFLNLGKTQKALGKFTEAEISIRQALSINPNLAAAYISLGIISKELNKLNEAELYLRKAIIIDPKLAISHYNLGAVLIDKGNIKEARISIEKSISLNRNLSKAYVTLSEIKDYSNNKEFREYLFSNAILNHLKIMDKIDIYFARSNVLHNLKNYQESSIYLKKANQAKLDIYPSDSNEYIAASKYLSTQFDDSSLKSERPSHLENSIFIVGMPRSGSTLLESIISMNNNVFDLGEVNLFQESYIEWKQQLKENRSISLSSIYLNKIYSITNDSKKITTNKSLYNYQYAGIISRHLINAKIIHCYRNPLDNILSIYRAHFDKSSRYSSSLEDCTVVYLDHETIMEKYKNEYPKKIYSLNYDKLVTSPKKEITSLINWLSWEWDDKYLSPHINPRSIKTASSIQVRAPINSKSVGLWKNYRELLAPSIDLLNKTGRYEYI